MRQHSRLKTLLACAPVVVVTIITLDGQYSLTVNQDRLINAQNEPQNWLLMNGDYGSTRYSRLTQINRDNVRDLRMVWALALGGMQDTGRDGPESEVNPLIDNGFMYTSDGWGTVYKIDARNADYGDFVWIADPGVDHEGNISRTRGIALLGRPRAGESARRPGDLHRPRHRRDRLGRADRRDDRVWPARAIRDGPARGRWQGHRP